MNFRNIKKTKNKAKKAKSPSNSRNNPEHFKFLLSRSNSVKLLKLYGGLLKIFVICIFIVAAVIVGYDFQHNLQLRQEINSQREVLIRKLKFWEDFISKTQNYPDAYFQASILEYELGDTFKAKMYLEKGFSLDPNSENGKKIKTLLK
jgi:hypothetical protein